MTITRELEDKLATLCGRYSINHEESMKFIQQVTRSMDGYYLFDSGGKIDLIFFSKIFFYYFQFSKNYMNSDTRHISDISKISTRLDSKEIFISILFEHEEGIDFSIPYKQFPVWMGFYRTLKVFWANTK